MRFWRVILDNCVWTRERRVTSSRKTQDDCAATLHTSTLPASASKVGTVDSSLLTPHLFATYNDDNFFIG